MIYLSEDFFKTNPWYSEILDLPQQTLYIYYSILEATLLQTAGSCTPWQHEALCVWYWAVQQSTTRQLIANWVVSCVVFIFQDKPPNGVGVL